MDDQQRARELLADQYPGDSGYETRQTILAGTFGDDETIAAITAALRAAPEGFVMVPVEPTREMVDASLISVPIAKRINPGQYLRVYGARAWAATLAARPKVQP